MRILLLTILFAGAFKVFSHKEENPNRIDSIRVKLGAPKRVNRSPAVLPVERARVEESDPPETGEGFVDEEPAQLTAGEHYTDGEGPGEDSWPVELKDMLLRLEPVDGEEIYQAYQAEQDAYQSELDALMTEKQQKTSEEGAAEMDHQLTQLDSKHEEKLKVIFGDHYEAIREHQQEFLEAGSAESYQ